MIYIKKLKVKGAENQARVNKGELSMKKGIFFFKHFLRNPSSVGALTELTDSVIEKMTKYLRERNRNKPCRILEAGAGNGSLTRRIIPELRPGDTLDAVEIDSTCCQSMLKKFRSHKQVKVICSSILDWYPDYQYDYIISTLPFNSFGAGFVSDILDHYEKIAKEGCIFSYVEYVGLAKLSLLISKKEKKQEIHMRRAALKNYQKNYMIEKNRILKNFLPCHVYHMRMKEAIY